MERKIFPQLMLLLASLAWNGAVIFVGLGGVFLLIMFAGSLGERLAAALGASPPAKVAGFIVAFVLLVGLQVGVGAAIGFTSVAFERRWPDSPVVRSVKWVHRNLCWW
jgi:hypothetical protein